MDAQANRYRAKRLLNHYLRQNAQATGTHWDSDNDAEVDEIVDCIIDAAVEEATRATEEENPALEEFRHQRQQAEAWAKAERGEP